MNGGTFVLVVLYCTIHRAVRDLPPSQKERKKKRKIWARFPRCDRPPNKAGNLGRKHIIRGDDANACCYLSRRDDSKKKQSEAKKEEEKKLACIGADLTLQISTAPSGLYPMLGWLSWMVMDGSVSSSASQISSAWS